MHWCIIKPFEGKELCRRSVSDLNKSAKGRQRPPGYLQCVLRTSAGPELVAGSLDSDDVCGMNSRSVAVVVFVNRPGRLTHLRRKL